MCKDGDFVPSTNEENVDSDNRDFVVADDLHSSKSFDVNGEEMSERAIEEFETETYVL